MSDDEGTRHEPTLGDFLRSHQYLLWYVTLVVTLTLILSIIEYLT